MSNDVMTSTPEAENAVAQAEEFAPVDLDKLTVEGADAPPIETETAPAEEPSGDEEAATPDPAEEEPPIEAPRSWKAEEKERFKALPRETQSYLAEREMERDRALNRSQNEAAEKLKGLTADKQAVEQARQNYEQALPKLFEALQSTQAGDYSDIKTIADVEKLARDDWPRYLQWDVAQKKIAAVQQEMNAAQQRQNQERAQKFAEFAQREDNSFTEKVPEAADKVKLEKLQKQAMSALQDVGFTEAEIIDSYQGQKDIPLRDHRLQLLIRDATLYREAQQKAKAAQPKPQPKPQTAGIGKPASNVVDLRSAADNGDMEAFMKLRAKGAIR